MRFPIQRRGPRGKPQAGISPGTALPCLLVRLLVLTPQLPVDVFVLVPGISA